MEAATRLCKIAATILLIQASISCIPKKKHENTEAVHNEAFSIPAEGAAYFASRYRRAIDIWHILGPFATPLDPLSRDILIAEGGENAAVPSEKPVTVPPRTTAAWHTTRALTRDFWIPYGLRTRYTGYVPVFSGKPGDGSRTALALSELYTEEKLCRILFRAWGSGRVIVNGEPVIKEVQFPGFFGQRDVFCRLKNGNNRFVVKLVNSTYNRTAGADRIFGSWGFSLEMRPAGRINNNLYADIPFVEDAFFQTCRLYGRLALRNRGKARRQKEIFTLECADAKTQIAVVTPPPGEDSLHPFMLSFPRGIPGTCTLSVKTRLRTLLTATVTPRTRNNTFFLRCIQSPTDGSLQPYLVYFPPRRIKSSPVVYIHGKTTTEEEPAAWASGLMHCAQTMGFGIIAPRARERALLSAQAQEDILHSIQEADADLKTGNTPHVLVGSGTGSICALKLAAHFPHRFKGLFLVIENPFETSSNDKPDLSDLESFAPALSRLGTTPVIIASKNGKNRTAEKLGRRLRMAEVPAEAIEVRSVFTPFLCKSAEKALRKIFNAAGTPDFPGISRSQHSRQHHNNLHHSSTASLDALFEKPHTTIIPDKPLWRKAARSLLARQTEKASFGRNPGAGKHRIHTFESLRRFPEENLILLGKPCENRVVNHYAQQIRYTLTDKEFRWNGDTFGMDAHVVLLVCKDPFRAGKTVAIAAGDPFMRFADACRKGEQAPFEHPEKKGAVQVWRLEEGTFRRIHLQNAEGR